MRYASVRFWAVSSGLALLAGLAQAGQIVEVVIAGMRFDPAEVKIKVGDTVKWVNHEKRSNHSILFEDHAESDRIFPGESWQRVFEKTGIHPYSCGPHPEMRGVVDVAE